MKSGYDQFFKKAQKIAAQNRELSPRDLPRSKKPSRANESQILIDQLRARVRPNSIKRAKKSVPWKWIGFSLVGFLLTAGGFLNMDKIDKVIRSVEVTMMGSAYASETKSETKADAKMDAKPGSKSDAKDTAEKVAGKAETPAEKKEFTAEEINHFSKLNERKRELDAREEELGRLEQELTNQKVEIEKRLTELDANRKSISSVLQEKVQVDDKKIENLVQLYSTMKPQQAAKAFEDMDEGLAVEILGRMKKKNAAEIMNLVKSEKVKILSEKYAGYKRN